MKGLTQRWAHMESLFESEAAFRRAVTLLPLFYIIVEFVAISQFAVLQQITAERFEPVWPVAWLAFVPGAAAVAPYIFLPLFLAGATVGALLYRRRWARILAFLSIFQYQAFLVSRQGSEHEFYLPLFISFMFIFLPDVWSAAPAADARKKFVLAYWGATAYLMLVYFMSGLMKILGAVQQIGETNYFSFDAAALYVSFYLDQFQRESLLGPVIIEHPIIGWVGLMAMLYVTLGSIAVLLRPALYRLWGMGYLLFHVSTLVSINLVFFFFPLFAAFLMLASPLSPERTDWRAMLRDIPVVGLVVLALSRLRGSEGAAADALRA